MNTLIVWLQDDAGCNRSRIALIHQTGVFNRIHIRVTRGLIYWLQLIFVRLEHDFLCLITAGVFLSCHWLELLVHGEYVDFLVFDGIAHRSSTLAPLTIMRERSDRLLSSELFKPGKSVLRYSIPWTSLRRDYRIR